MLDRENIINTFEKIISVCKKDGYDFVNLTLTIEHAEQILALLKEQEAVEAKTGHWIESKCLDECFWVCSECNFQSEAIAAPKLYKYCPNCGTKMEEQAVK